MNVPGTQQIRKPISALASLMAIVMSMSFGLHGSTAEADEVDNVCGSVLNSPNPSASGAPGGDVSAKAQAQQQKLQYCQAARTAQDAADADAAMWKVWAAVGVVCTYGCVASLAGGPTSEYICMGASLAGGVTDAVMTKNFASAMMSVAGVGAGFAANQAINGSATPAASAAAGETATQTPTPPKKDIGACLNAAMAMMQVFVKHKGMTDNQATVTANLASAKSVQAAAETVAQTQAGYQPGIANDGSSGAGGNTGSVTGAGNGDGTVTANGGNGTNNGSCAGQSAGNTNPAATMQCAVASDQTIPSFVKDPNFTKEFQKDSGKSLADFLGGNGTPNSMLASATSKGMTSGQSTKIAAAIDEISQYAESGAGTASMYAGGGGGGHESSGSGDEAAQMGAMMEGLMAQLNPNKSKEEQATGVRAVIFANQRRGPAAVAEDRKLSIFDRVTYRYYFVGRRIVLGEGERQ